MTKLEWLLIAGAVVLIYVAYQAYATDPYRLTSAGSYPYAPVNYPGNNGVYQIGAGWNSATNTVNVNAGLKL